ncbi:MAG: hypothetical protein D6705_15025 [Deltaproteobacteria bacterium]|nr:MAG: hypothetical protein D6705_15025 [Deltaproteobacteria bacterium]
MFARILHVTLALGGIGLLPLAAPKGALLVPEPERGRVQAKDPTTHRTTARGRGPTFLWLGGGYHGGK